MEKTINNCSDSELVLRFQTGDDASFNTIVKRYQQLIRLSILKQNVGEDLADDFTQDTFMRAFEHLRNPDKPHDPNGNLGNWLSRIAINICMDHYRKLTRHPILSMEDLSLKDRLTLSDYQPSTEEMQIVRDEQNFIRDCIRELPDEQMEVLMFRQYGHIHFKHIAAIVDISINTAVGRHRYALNNLRKIAARNSAIPLLHAS